MVKLLLGRDNINLDRPNMWGRTPLWAAARNGHEGVVGLLLGRGVNPDMPSLDGQTPFSCPAENGHMGVMALLHPPAAATHSTA